MINILLTAIIRLGLILGTPILAYLLWDTFKQFALEVIQGGDE